MMLNECEEQSTLFCNKGPKSVFENQASNYFMLLFDFGNLKTFQSYLQYNKSTNKYLENEAFQILNYIVFITYITCSVFNSNNNINDLYKMRLSKYGTEASYG